MSRPSQWDIVKFKLEHGPCLQILRRNIISLMGEKTMGGHSRCTLRYRDYNTGGDKVLVKSVSVKVGSEVKLA